MTTTGDTPHALIANVPGYSPNADPIVFDTRQEAIDARRDEMIYGADDLADSYGEFHPIVSQWIDEFDSDEDTISLPLSDSPHDLGICFDIMPVHTNAGANK